MEEGVGSRSWEDWMSVVAGGEGVVDEVKEGVLGEGWVEIGGVCGSFVSCLRWVSGK